MLRITALTGVGWTIVTLACPEHPFTSVTVTPYVPAESPVALGPVCPLDHTKLNGEVPVPACTIAVAEPVFPLAQSTLVKLPMTTTGAVANGITTVATLVQPLASVTVTT